MKALINLTFPDNSTSQMIREVKTALYDKEGETFGLFLPGEPPIILEAVSEEDSKQFFQALVKEELLDVTSYVAKILDTDELEEEGSNRVMSPEDFFRLLSDGDDDEDEDGLYDLIMTRCLEIAIQRHMDGKINVDDADELFAVLEDMEAELEGLDPEMSDEEFEKAFDEIVDRWLSSAFGPDRGDDGDRPSHRPELHREYLLQILLTAFDLAAKKEITIFDGPTFIDLCLSMSEELYESFPEDKRLDKDMAASLTRVVMNTVFGLEDADDENDD